GELLQHAGGSFAELQTVYAIVDTLALNVPNIKRIGILVNGQTRQTLAGHVFTAEPLAPDFRYVEESARPATPGVPTTPDGAEKPGGDAGDGTGARDDGRKPGDGASGEDGDRAPETPRDPS